jgi:hypothetical protein
MKYLFFFNGQLFLLCCMCCKIAIQDFVTPLQKKIRKIYGFTDGYTDGIKPVGISQRVEKQLRDCAIFTDGVTDGLKPVGISQRVAKIYGIVPQSPTESPTNLRTSRSARMSDMCPSAQIPTD